MADQSFREFLPEWTQLGIDRFASGLRFMLEPLDVFLSGLTNETARWCAIMLFAVAGVWVWTLKREYVYRGAPDETIWRDLRLWSVFALCPYAIIYLFFF